MQMDDEKTILDWPTLKCLIDVRNFGIILHTIHQKFQHHYFAPMMSVLKKNFNGSVKLKETFSN